MGTLVELEPPVPALRRELAHRFGLDITPDAASIALAAEIRHYRAHMARARDARTLARLRQDCAVVLRDALPRGSGAGRIDIPEMTDALVASLRFRAHPDARRTLLRAREAGVRIVVVSNWDVSLPDVLERVGLAPLLWAVVTSAGVGSGKPAPAIFRYALALAGVPPTAALHVGDSLAEDVRGAQACEIRSILLARDEQEARLGAQVPRIARLDELIF
jgi:HAD superfamily hydrolase (TIGR01549 family)